jgi:hypothetical protein
LDERHLRRNQIRMQSSARKITPPTTPPAMAPTLVLEGAAVGVGVWGTEVLVGVEAVSLASW